MKEATTLNEASLRGQADIWKYMLGFADSMALRSVVELRIPDIINSHGRAISLSEIASSFDSSAPDISCLSRIMRFLVHRNIFTAHQDSEDVPEKTTLYGLTHSSRWLLHDAKLTLAPMILLETNSVTMASWNCFSQCALQAGSCAFERANERDAWKFFSENPEIGRLFNNAMACATKVSMKAILSGYKSGFEGVETPVDVGGGIGSAMAEIVRPIQTLKA